jgi:hypothetical protein
MSDQPVSAPAAGWHPDPSGPGALRWWDGQRWTEHTQPLPAPAPAAAPAPAPAQREVAPEGEREIHIDTDMKINAFKSKHLVVTPELLIFDKREIRFAEVTSVAYWMVNVKVNGVPTASQRFVELGDRQGKVKIPCLNASVQSKASKQTTQAIFESIVHALGLYVEPRLCDEAIAQIRAQQPYAIKSVTVRSDGFALGRALREEKVYAWSDLAGTAFQEGSVRIFVHGAKKAVGAVPMQEPNAVLLPDILGRLAQGRA